MNKNYTYTYKVEEGKIVEVTCNGKPIKKSLMNALKKAQETLIWRMEVDAGIAQNGYTGVEFNLNAFELSVYRWCASWYSLYSGIGKMVTSIQIYDNMRYLLLAINPDAYYGLLD